MRVPESLTTELARWNHGKGVSPSTWISLVGRFHDFVGFSRLIWPEFVELHGRVYLADFFDAARLESMQAASQTQRDAQAFMNALDLSGFFRESQPEISDDDIRSMAALLKETWSAKLSLNFPNRTVRVVVEDNLDEVGVGEMLLSVIDE